MLGQLGSIYSMDLIAHYMMMKLSIFMCYLYCLHYPNKYCSCLFARAQILCFFCFLHIIGYCVIIDLIFLSGMQGLAAFYLHKMIFQSTFGKLLVQTHTCIIHLHAGRLPTVLYFSHQLPQYSVTLKLYFIIFSCSELYFIT